MGMARRNARMTDMPIGTAIRNACRMIKVICIITGTAIRNALGSDMISGDDET